MYNKKMRRIFGIFLCLLMFQTLISSVGPTPSFAASVGTITGVKVYEKGTKNPKTSIYENDEFDLKLNYNTTGTAPIFIEVFGDNFYPVEGSNRKSITAGSGSVNFTMIRRGKENSLKVRFTDSSAPTEQITTTTVFIKEAEKIEDSDSESKPKSKSEKDPDLVFDPGAKVQEFVAGQDGKLSLPFDTLRKTAKNIKATFTDKPEDMPFIFDDAKPWVYIDAVTRNGKTVTKPVTISPLAKSKVYSLAVKLEYENGSGDSYTKETTFYIKITNEEVEPLLGLSRYEFSKKKLRADGGKQAVVMMVHNGGTLEAKGVRVQIKGFTTDGIHLDKDIDTKAIKRIGPGEEEMVYFNIKPADNAKTGQFPLEVEITYDDEAGTEYKKTSNVYVPVEGQDSDSIDIKISNIVRPEKVQSGESFEIGFDVANLSLFDVEEVELSLELPSGFVPKTSPRIQIKDFKKDAVQHQSFSVLATDTLKKGYYDLYVVTKYKGEGDKDFSSFKEYVGVGIDGKTGLGRPKVLIEDYSFDGKTVMAGENFDLKLKFFNTSTDDIVKNIKVSVSADEGAFSPVDSSSSFFIERIDRRGYVEKVLKLETKRDAKVQTYNLKLVMKYEDGQGNAYDSQEKPFEEEETIGIPVAQPIRLEVGDVKIPGEAQVGSPVSVELEFYNMGRAPMYNMFVRLKGDFQIQDGTYFVGNFEQGKNEYFSGTVVPQKEGESKGKLVFEFEDALGNTSSIEKEFSFSAVEMSEADLEGKFGIDGEGEGPEGGDQDKGGIPKKIIYGLIALAVVVIAVIIIRRRRKRKKALLMELEDDDE